MPRAAECLRSFSFSEIRARFPRFSAGNPTENGRSASARSETAYRPPAQRPGKAAHSAARAACRCRASRRDTAPALPQGPAQILRKVDILFAAGNAVQQQHGGMQSFAACRIQHGQQPSASAVQQDTVHIRPVRAVSVMCLTASYFSFIRGALLLRQPPRNYFPTIHIVLVCLYESYHPVPKLQEKFTRKSRLLLDAVLLCG